MKVNIWPWRKKREEKPSMFGMVEVFQHPDIHSSYVLEVRNHYDPHDAASVDFVRWPEGTLPAIVERERRPMYTDPEVAKRYFAMDVLE